MNPLESEMAPERQQDTAAQRRAVWWEREAQRPPGATMTAWAARAVEPGQPVQDARALLVAELGATPGAPLLHETLSDRDAHYYGFQPVDAGPAVERWAVAARYELADGHAGRAAVFVLLTVGDTAELVTPLHPADAPMVFPADAIAVESGLGMSELPGRWFSVATLSEGDAKGFRLISDL